MAYPVNSLTTSGTGTGSGSAFTIPSLTSGYLVDDVICILLSQDTAAATLSCSTGGWTTVATNSGASPTSQANSVLAYKKAASTSETPPAFACANAALIWTSFVLRDVDTSTAIDVNSSNSSGTKDFTASTSTGMPSVTANYADSLAIYCVTADAVTKIRFEADDVCAVAAYSHTSNSVSHTIGYHQLTSTTVPTPTAYLTQSEGGNKWTIVFKNKSGGALAPQLRGSITELDSGKLANWFGDFGNTHSAISTWAAPSNFAGTINSVTVSTNAPTISNAGTLLTLGACTVITNGTNANEITGGYRSFTSTDITGKILAFTWAISGQNSTGARINTDGAMYGLTDGTNWAVYQLASKAKGWISADAQVAVIDVSTATPIYSSGTLDLAAVTGDAFLWHRASGSATQDAFLVKNLMVIDNCVMTGGGSSRPLTWKDLWQMLGAWDFFKLAVLQGPNQILAKFDVQVGDGSALTYFDSSEQALALPQAYSLSSTENWQQDWNVGEGAITLGIKAGASDTINLASGLLSCAVSQDLSVDQTSSTAATHSFAAQIISNVTPTLLSGWTFNGTTFSGCGPVNSKGATLTNVTVKKPNSNVGASNAALVIDTSGSTLDGTTIDLTGASGSPGYHLELGTSVTAITLTDVTFTGTAGTDKVHVLRTTGTVTISLSGATTLAAGDVTTEGATVSIVSDPVNQVVVVSGFTSGSRIQIYDTTNAVELFNGTASSGDTVVSGTTATWTDPVAAAGDRAIRVRVAYVSGATAKQFEEASGLTCGTTAGTATVTYPISPVDDDVYNDNAINGSLVTGVTFTDAATDLVNIDVAGGTISIKSIYAAFVYWLSTASGIDDNVAYIDAKDTANYVFTSMKIKNTSSPTVATSITGGYFYDSTSGSIADCIDTTGGSLFPMPDHVVPFATGSGVTSQDKIDIAAQVLSQAASAPIASNIKQVNDLTVNGAGTEANPWGP